LCDAEILHGETDKDNRPLRSRNPLCYDSRLVALRLKLLLHSLDRVSAYRMRSLTDPNLTAKARS